MTEPIEFNCSTNCDTCALVCLEGSDAEREIIYVKKTEEVLLGFEEMDDMTPSLIELARMCNAGSMVSRINDRTGRMTLFVSTGFLINLRPPARIYSDLLNLEASVKAFILGGTENATLLIPRDRMH